MKGGSGDFLSNLTYYASVKLGMRSVDDLELALVVACLITGSIWAYYLKNREKISGDGYLARILKGGKSWFLVFLSILVIRATILEPFKVGASDLEPEVASYSYVIIDKMSWGIRLPLTNRLITYREPKHGEIVMVQYPRRSEERNIKRLGRVIGLPGQTVDVDYRSRKAVVSGREAPYEHQFKGQESNSDRALSIKVPENSILVVTDSFYTEQFEDPEIVLVNDIVGSIYMNIDGLQLGVLADRGD